MPNRKVIYLPKTRNVEKLGYALAEEFERSQGRTPVFVGDDWHPTLLDPVRAWAEERGGPGCRVTCDYVSLADGRIDRLIEVKARGGSGTSVSLVDRQYEAMQALGTDWWLYAAFDCKKPDPFLVVVGEPRRLPWRRGTLPRGAANNVESEGTWYVMPDEIISVGERVPRPLPT